jgi:hypothetical protein
MPKLSACLVASLLTCASSMGISWPRAIRHELQLVGGCAPEPPAHTHSK